MAKQIIAALRRLPQLKGSTLLAAVELAHRADASSGVAYMSYSYLAAKCHQSRRTAIRQVHRLLELGLITCEHTVTHVRRTRGAGITDTNVFTISTRSDTHGT